MMNDGWGDDDEFLSDEFEDIIDNDYGGEKNINERNFPPKEELRYMKNEPTNGNHTNYASTPQHEVSSPPIISGWGDDDSILADDEDDDEDDDDDESNNTPVLQQLHHHVWPLSIPLDLASSTHVETCASVILEQALLEEEENDDQGNGWSFDEASSALESSVWQPEEHTEEKKQSNGMMGVADTKIKVVKSESSQPKEDEHCFTQKEAQSKERNDVEPDKVLTQLQYHVPPLTVPIQRIRTCSVDVELELAHEEEGQLQQHLEEPIISTMETVPSEQKSTSTVLEVTPPAAASFNGAPILNKETSWDLEDNFDFDQETEEKLLKNLDTIDINSALVPPTSAIGDAKQQDFGIETAPPSATISSSTVQFPVEVFVTISSPTADESGIKNHHHESTNCNNNMSNNHLEDSLVDYSKLLEAEMTKNIILNKHVETLQFTIDELQSLQENTETLAQQSEQKAIAKAKDLTAQIQCLQLSLNTLQEQKVQDENKMSHLQSTSNDVRRELDQLLATLENMQHSFQQEKDRLESENHDLRTNLVIDREEVLSLREQIHQITQQKSVIHDRCALLECENHDVLHQLQTEQLNLASERENAVFLTSSLSEMRRHQHMQEEMEKKLEKLQREHKAHVDSLLSKNHGLEKEVEAYNGQAENMKRLENELVSLQQHHGNENREWLQQLQEGKSNLALEQESVSRLKCQLEEMRRDLKALTQQTKAQMQDQSLLENLEQQHQSQLQVLLNNIHALENQNEFNEGQKEKLQHELKLAYQELNAAVDEKEAALLQVSDLAHQLEDAQQRVHIMEQRYFTMEHEKNQLSEETSCIKKERALLEKEHNCLNEEVRAKETCWKQQSNINEGQKEKLQHDLKLAYQELNTAIDEKETALLQASDLAHQLQDAQRREHIMEQRYFTMEHEKNQLSEETSCIKKERALLEKERNCLNDEVRAKERHLKEQSDSKLALEEQLVSSNQELQNLQYRLEDSLAEKDQFVSENEELLIQLGLEGQKQQRLDAEFHNVTADFEEQLGIILAEKDEIEMRLETLLQENLRLKEEIEVLSNQTQTYQEKLDNYVTAIVEIDDRPLALNSCDTDVNNLVVINLQEKLHAASQNLECLEELCEDKTQQIAMLKRALDVANSKNSQLLSECSSNANDIASSIAVEKVEFLEKTCGEKAQEIVGLKEVLSDITERNSSLTVSFEQANAALSEQVDKLKECQRELACYDDSLSKCQDRCKSFEEDRNSLLEQLASQELILKGMQHINICADLSTNDAESVGFMRERIISLATALEKSEQLRAAAIDRISTERRDHAESLRKVSENVKRFYSTFTRGQAAVGS